MYSQNTGSDGSGGLTSSLARHAPIHTRASKFLSCFNSLVHARVGLCKKSSTSQERCQLCASGHTCRPIPDELVPVARWCYDIYFEANLVIGSESKGLLKGVLGKVYKPLKELTTALKGNAPEAPSRLAIFATVWNSFDCVGARGPGWDKVGRAPRGPLESYFVTAPGVPAPIIDLLTVEQEGDDSSVQEISPAKTSVNLRAKQVHPEFLKSSKGKAKELTGYFEPEDEGEDVGETDWLDQFVSSTPKTYGSLIPDPKATADPNNPDDARRLGAVYSKGLHLWAETLEEAQTKKREREAWNNRERLPSTHHFTQEVSEAVDAANSANQALLKLLQRQAVDNNTEISDSLEQFSILSQRLTTQIHALHAPLEERVETLQKEHKAVMDKLDELQVGTENRRSNDSDLLQFGTRLAAVEELAQTTEQNYMSKVEEKIEERLKKEQKHVEDFVRTSFATLMDALRNQFVEK